MATDLDETRFEAGAGDFTFMRHYVLADPVPGTGFDLVHARFLLEHLSEPRLAIRRFREALRPGGSVVLEDSAGLAIAAIPESRALERLRSPWEQAGLTVGWDAAYGTQLISDLQASGFLTCEAVSIGSSPPGEKAGRTSPRGSSGWPTSC